MHRWKKGLGFALIACLMLGACGESRKQPTSPELSPADEVYGILLRVGADDSVSFTRTGLVSGDLPVAIPPGPDSARVVAELVKSGPERVQLPGDQFHLRVRPNDTTVVTYSPQGSFSGWFLPRAVGGAYVSVSLVSDRSGDVLIGPSVVDVEVLPGAT